MGGCVSLILLWVGGYSVFHVQYVCDQEHIITRGREKSVREGA